MFDSQKILHLVAATIARLLVPFRLGTEGSWLTSTVPPARDDINAATISHREMEFHAANPFRRHTRLIYSRGPWLSVSPSAIGGRTTADLHVQPRSHVSQDLPRSRYPDLRVDRVTRRSKSPFWPVSILCRDTVTQRSLKSNIKI